MTGAQYMALRSGDVIRFRKHLRVVVAPGPICVTLRKLRPGKFPANPTTAYTYGEIAEATITGARAKLTKLERTKYAAKCHADQRNGVRQQRLRNEAARIDHPKFVPVPLQLMDDDGRWVLV